MSKLFKLLASYPFIILMAILIGCIIPKDFLDFGMPDVPWEVQDMEDLEELRLESLRESF